MFALAHVESVKTFEQFLAAVVNVESCLISNVGVSFRFRSAPVAVFALLRVSKHSQL